MKIGENIEALELPMNLRGQSSIIYPALLWDFDEATLVDTGIPGQLDALRGEIEKAGVDFESISRIILTHQDIDHIGGLPEILRARGEEGIEVFPRRGQTLHRGRQALAQDESRAHGPNDGIPARIATPTAPTNLV